MTFWGVFRASFLLFSYIKGPKHPLKKSYSKCLRRTQIRWVIWQSSRKLGQAVQRNQKNKVHVRKVRVCLGAELWEGGRDEAEISEEKRLSKPMVCQTYRLGAGRFSRKRQKSRKRRMRRRQLRLQQGVECWIWGNRGNHENRGLPKPRV